MGYSGCNLLPAIQNNRTFGEIIKRSIRDIYMTLNHGKVFLIRVYPIKNTHTK